MTEKEKKAAAAAAAKTGDGGTDPTKNEKTDTSEAFDPKKLGDEDFAKIFDDQRLWDHPRFKQLNADAKAGRVASKKIEGMETAKLEENKEYKVLAEKNKAKADSLEKRMQIMAVAQSLGVKDLEVISKLVDHDKITVADDGTITGAKEQVEALLKSKPYLKGEATNDGTTVGSGTNPGGDDDGGKKKFTHSQIQNPEFYKKNEPAILEAIKNNQVENDIPV